ncbi:MAG: hypothetical protein FJ149_07745 [Euryarchaeota archaeon]|nr:hypothetical protein [Euryarchaeota archaeon]
MLPCCLSALLPFCLSAFLPSCPSAFPPFALAPCALRLRFLHAGAGTTRRPVPCLPRCHP